MRAQQDDLDAASAQRSGEVVRGAAGLHDDSIDRTVREEPFKLGTREAVLFDDVTLGVSDRDLVNILCEVDGGGCRIHLGLLL